MFFKYFSHTKKILTPIWNTQQITNDFCTFCVLISTSLLPCTSTRIPFLFFTFVCKILFILLSSLKDMCLSYHYQWSNHFCWYLSMLQQWMSRVELHLVLEQYLLVVFIILFSYTLSQHVQNICTFNFENMATNEILQHGLLSYNQSKDHTSFYFFLCLVLICLCIFSQFLVSFE